MIPDKFFSKILLRFDQVKFVAHYDNWNVLFVGLMVPNFLNPLIYLFICFLLGQVKNDDDAISVLEVARRYCIISLLPSCIPYLKITEFLVRGLELVGYLGDAKG